MRTLTPREKRTVQIAAILLGVYLALFYGTGIWRSLESARVEYRGLQASTESLNLKILRAQKKAKRFARLGQTWGIHGDRLEGSTIVTEAREAIERAAKECGVGLGASKETPGRSSSRALRVFQIEGVGKTEAVMGFLHKLRTLGYPLVIDRLNIDTKKMKPGQVRLALSVAILNFKAWKAAEKNA